MANIVVYNCQMKVFLYFGHILRTMELQKMVDYPDLDYSEEELCFEISEEDMEQLILEEYYGTRGKHIAC